MSTSIYLVGIAFCMTAVFVAVALTSSAIMALLAAIGITGLAADAIWMFAFFSFLMLGGVQKVWHYAAAFYDWAVKTIHTQMKGGASA